MALQLEGFIDEDQVDYGHVNQVCPQRAGITQ